MQMESQTPPVFCPNLSNIVLGILVGVRRRRRRRTANMLSDRHMRVLAAIALAPHLSVDELAAVVGEERRDVEPLCDEFEAAGLIAGAVPSVH